MDEKYRIEKVMEAEKMNSVQFATETGIQTSTLSHILNGRNKVSLDVLKKILNRFHNISSDWLILGVGSMYRQEKQSKAPTLFDFNTKTYSESESLPDDNSIKSPLEKVVNYEDKSLANEFMLPKEIIVSKDPRKITRIIVYFDDNSYQEFFGD